MNRPNIPETGMRGVLAVGIAFQLFIGARLLAQANAWTTKAPMPAPRAWLATAVADNVLYAVGGDNTDISQYELGALEAYDPRTDSWTAKAPLPTVRAALAAAAIGGVLYAIGGQNASSPYLSTLEAYNPKTNSWSPRASMPTPRAGLAAATLGGTLYAVGGLDSSGYQDTLEAYDPKTNSWTEKSPMPTPRAGLAVGVIRGVLYALGGHNLSSLNLATIEAYDPATDRWTTLGPMPNGRDGLTVAVIDGRLYAIGGFPYVQGDSYTVDAYDPTTNAWSTEPSMPTSRTALSGSVIGDLFFAIGGYRILREGSRFTGINEAFTPYLSVAIKVKPNTINLRANEKIKVAILSTSTFDATSVVPDSVKLSGALADTEANGTPIYSFEDVNGDGILDLVLTFRARNLQLTKADKQVVLKGQTFAGQLIKGVASVRIVP
jgi:N-acetylneuraminic acid mutarotase